MFGRGYWIGFFVGLALALILASTVYPLFAQPWNIIAAGLTGFFFTFFGARLGAKHIDGYDIRNGRYYR